MKKIKKNDINLYDTITCGQIFRFIIKENEFILILSDRVVKLSEDNNFIYISSSNEENIEDIVSTYLGLYIDYDKINKELVLNDPSLKSAIDSCKGLKVMNSPKLETMISYMISATNNVRNIQKSVNKLSEKCGEKIIFENEEYYLFPTLDALKKLTITDFNDAKLGFRSKNIYEFVNKITYSDIDKIDKMTSPEAIDYLCTFRGIGLKIASCILLFGYKRLDVFPIDTWVKKYMNAAYGINDPKNIEKFAKEKYKDYSGLVIQYMFHAERNK